MQRDFLIPLENLLTLAMGLHCPIAKLEIWPAVSALAAPEQPQWIEVVSPTVAAVSDPQRPLNPASLLFRLSDIEPRFQEHLSRWFASVKRYDSACNLLFSHIRAPAPFSETNFLTVAQAAEVYHRRGPFGNEVAPTADHAARIAEILGSASTGLRGWLKQALQFSNEKRLNDRLNELVNEIAVMLPAGFFGPPRTFARRVTDTRHYLTHWAPARKASAADGVEMVELTEKLEVLVQVALLRELGFDVETCRRLLEANQRIGDLASSAVVGTARAQSTGSDSERA